MNRVRRRVHPSRSEDVSLCEGRAGDYRGSAGRGLVALWSGPALPDRFGRLGLVFPETLSPITTPVQTVTLEATHLIVRWRSGQADESVGFPATFRSATNSS